MGNKKWFWLSLLVPYMPLAARLLQKRPAVCADRLSCTIESSKPKLGPPVWWWSGLAASAAVAFGSEGYRSPLLLYIGASVAVAASRKLLMGPAKRPPTAAETQTLDAIRVDLRTPFDEARHGDLLKKLWKAGLDGPFARHSTKWQLLGFQGEDPCTDLRACKLLGLKTFLTFLEASPRYADASSPVGE